MNPGPPGWYPEADESYQRWWDGVAWTGYRRVSRFPGFVERVGRPVFRGQNLFPAGDGVFETMVRRTQTLSLVALGLIVIGTPLALIGSILMAGDLSLAALVVPAAIAIVVMLVALIPAFKVYGLVRRVRDAHARGEFFVTLGPDGAPVSRPAGQAEPPGWE